MFNDVFRPIPQHNVPGESFTEGAEEPFEAMDIEEITPTDYGAFVLQALSVMKKGKQREQPTSTPDLTPVPKPEPNPTEPSCSTSLPPPPSPQKKRKRGEEEPSTSNVSTSSPTSVASSSRQPLPASSSASSSTPIPQTTSSTSSQPLSSSPASGSSIDQDVLRQSLRLASSFLLTDSTLNPELGLETWGTGLGRLIEIILSLHRSDTLEVETMREAAQALRDCWVAGGAFPGLEDSRNRIREDGQKLKKLLDDPDSSMYKGQRF